MAPPYETGASSGGGSFLMPLAPARVLRSTTWACSPAPKLSKMREWVGEIRFSPAVERKLRIKHHLTPAQVKRAIAWGTHDWARWSTHPIYGRRLIISGSDAEGPVVAYLRPIDRKDGLWECLTAWRMD